MTHMLNIVRRSSAFFSGVVLGLAGVTPVFAATLDGQLTPTNLMLGSSLILLGIGIALKVMEQRRASDAGPDEPDLRWWLNA